ncbi:hypothetical protein H310_08274 [Aphanomyces invadans]|nr:hypothetical protein H310_08274 [Aphanomyces invadans]ETV99624.1 hypothetical protein H310_08274 [Aphanomyces invadans]|eukprot:XP_008872180.1 hypothetical protein H310_08274 [Aphanomyces invadans]
MGFPTGRINDLASILGTTKIHDEDPDAKLIDNIQPGDRESVQKKLMAVLIALKPNTPVQKRVQLPSLVKKLETILLRLAHSKDEYMDPTTILPRLQAVHNFRLAKRQRTDPTK